VKNAKGCYGSDVLKVEGIDGMFALSSGLCS